MRRPADIWTKKEEARLRKMATMAITRTEAARRLERDASTVSKHIRLAGLEWKPPPKKPRLGLVERRPNPHAWTDLDDEWLLALAEAGWSQGMAANEMDRPTNTVIRHSKALGIRWPQGNKSRKGAPVERPG